MKRVIVTAGAVLVATAIGAAPARAACASAVYVRGVLELGSLVKGRHLPPADGTVRAVMPGCSDTGRLEPDRRVRLTRLRGVAPTVAVRDDIAVYVGQGQLTMLAGHPLRTPTPRRGACRPGPVVVRRAVADLGSVTLGTVQLDRGTRLVDRRVTFPMVTGQRVRATTSRCGRRLLADDVTVLRPVLHPKRRAPVFHVPRASAAAAGTPVAAWAGGALVLVLAAAGLSRRRGA
jgi:hypothetical protein